MIPGDVERVERVLRDELQAHRRLVEEQLLNAAANNTRVIGGLHDDLDGFRLGLEILTDRIDILTVQERYQLPEPEAQQVVLLFRQDLAQRRADVDTSLVEIKRGLAANRFVVGVVLVVLVVLVFALMLLWLELRRRGVLASG